MTDIKREAGDKTKGFTLQKQRALALFFDEVKSNPNTHVNVAIEYQGDVFLQNENTYIEEQKNFAEDSTFSFNSHQIKNTLVYFLKIWLSQNKSLNIKFGFYSTNKIAKEYSSQGLLDLRITLPKEGVLKLVVEKRYNEENLIDAVTKYLINEYQEQYKIDITSELDETSLIQFLESINWYFEQDNDKEYKAEVLTKIRDSACGSYLTKSYQEEFVYAALMLSLEEKQDEKDSIVKFLRKDSVENLFLKISKNEELDLKAYKYLTIDLSEFKEKTKIWLELFLENKYYSNIKDKSFPELLTRTVAKHNRGAKIYTPDRDKANPENTDNLDIIVKEFGDLINDTRPTFLFGEIGSGKSTLLAHHFLNEVTNGILPIFIPSSFLKGKITAELKNLKLIINDFVNEELGLSERTFDIDVFLLTKREISLIFDGLDEFDFDEAKRLFTHLLNLSNTNLNISVFASGRPIELQGLVNTNQWNCLTTLHLTENEVRQLLKNEALASGLSIEQAQQDALERWDILNSKQELLAISNTPLIVCLIRDFLDPSIGSKTLGDILYEVLKNRLDWHKADQKESLTTFLKAYPHVLQREKFITAIAFELYLSKSGKISENKIYSILNSETLISNNIVNRDVLVNETIIFIKGNFLQKIGNDYIFQSHQLHQFVVGLHLYDVLCKGEAAQYKENDLGKAWREISYLATVCRHKGENTHTEKYFCELIDELAFTSDNTPALSVLLAEAQNNNLNVKFLSNLQKLPFRPLKYWNHKDSLVPHAYAYIFKDLGETGFNWFFENYLNPKHPSRTGHDDLAVLILQYYLLISDFKINDNIRNKLTSIAPFHIAARTFSCHTIIPTIALLSPEVFNINDRCILLADATGINLLKNRAEELINKEFSAGNEKEVINGLEVSCRGNREKSKHAIEIWLRLVNEDVPELILNSCITFISKGEERLFEIVRNRIGDKNFQAYLRFCAINNSEISDGAAIILYNHYGERNPILVGMPIFKKASWIDYKNLFKEKIINDLILHNPIGENYILNYIPEYDEKFGVAELYLKFFLMTLENSEKLHVNMFLTVVRHLGKFTLARYPEIREGFARVITKTEYHEALKKSIKNLDHRLRYNAASILVVSNPENEIEALDIIIKSASRDLDDNHEFLRVCMKLTLNASTLEHIHHSLQDLRYVPKIFALKLLYHNNEYKLTDVLFCELITGLMGEASFLDWSGNLSDDGVQKVLGNSKFYTPIRQNLDADDIKLQHTAASTLLYNHTSKLTNKEKAYCWLLYIQKFEHALLDFHARFKNLLDNKDFTDGINEKSVELKQKFGIKNPVFLKYYEALKKNANWADFILAVHNSSEYSGDERIEHLYGLFIDIAKTDPTQYQRLGKAFKQIMSYPSYNQEKSHNIIYPQLSILAQEFNELTNTEIVDILTNYKIIQDESACALLYRLGEIHNEYKPYREVRDYISLFATNPVIRVQKFNINELNVLLEDGKYTPNNFTQAIQRILLNNILSDEDLSIIKEKSDSGLYFYIVINFCRANETFIQDYIQSYNEDSYRYFVLNKLSNYKYILYRIKEILITDKEWKERYEKKLLQQINLPQNSGNTVELFKELFAVNAKFEPQYLPILFDSLLKFPPSINLDIIYNINKYILDLNNDEQQSITKELKKICATVNNSPKHRHKSELELMSWSLSLILLHIEKSIDDDIERSFLNGLKNIFIEQPKYYYDVAEEKTSFFQGRLLMSYSKPLIKMIDPVLFKTLIQKGVDSNVPEISSVCTFFSAFSSN